MSEISNMRAARRREVLEVVVLEGIGTGPGDVAREVTYYFDEVGELLAKRDPWAGGLFGGGRRIDQGSDL